MRTETAFDWAELRCPGLTVSGVKIRDLCGEIPRKLAVEAYKSRMETLWIVLIGGTGTGKSSVFNALVGCPISRTGVERPKTKGPVAFAHRDCALEREFPFAGMVVKRIRADSSPCRASSGEPGQLLVFDHQREDWAHLVIVDSPDLDSVEARNRQIVEDLYLLADFVVFVSSQEKYADEVPFDFLLRIQHEGKPFSVIVNKVEGRLSIEDLLGLLGQQGVHLKPDQVTLFPFLPDDPSTGLAGRDAFQSFRAGLLQMFRKSRLKDLSDGERDRLRRDLVRAGEELLTSLEGEARAAAAWLEQLDHLCQWSSRNLLVHFEEHFLLESRGHIQREIRKHFGKYDPLGRPRRWLTQVIRAPLQALGLIRGDSQEHSREAIYELLRKTDFRSIAAEVDVFNRCVLEQLTPHLEGSELRKRLQDESLMLTDEEVQMETIKGLDLLAGWLEATFQKLAGGISRGKELGIYSTSILWGGLILALEVAVGGGISILQAVLDTAVAPFVTRGAVELFAYRELQAIAKELSGRYQEVILKALEVQRERYRNCLESCLTPPAVFEGLKQIVESLLQEAGRSYPRYQDALRSREAS